MGFCFPSPAPSLGAAAEVLPWQEKLSTPKKISAWQKKMADSSYLAKAPDDYLTILRHEFSSKKGGNRSEKFSSSDTKGTFWKGDLPRCTLDTQNKTEMWRRKKVTRFFFDSTSESPVRYKFSKAETSDFIRCDDLQKQPREIFWTPHFFEKKCVFAKQKKWSKADCRDRSLSWPWEGRFRKLRGSRAISDKPWNMKHETQLQIGSLCFQQIRLI